MSLLTALLLRDTGRVRKTTPGLSQVHVNRPLGSRERKDDPGTEDADTHDDDPDQLAVAQGISDPTNPRDKDDPGTEDADTTTDGPLPPLEVGEGPNDPLLDPRDKKKSDIAKRISGSSNIGLNAKGRALAERLGKRCAVRGCFDVLYSSPLTRGVETARAILKACPNTRYAKPAPELQPWHLGKFEGKEGKEHKDQIHYFIEHPDEQPPGMGADGKPAETFNQGKKRQLSFLSSVYDDLTSDPTIKICIVMHGRGMDLLKSWVDEDCPPDYELDTKDLIDPDDVPHATMLRWHKDKISKIDLDEDDPFKPGVYVVIHSLTDDDTDEGNEQLEKIQKFLPPAEVLRAAQSAWDAGNAVIGITSELVEGDGLTIDKIQKIAEHFDSDAVERDTPMMKDSWGGYYGGKWAFRVLRKIEREKIVKQGRGIMVAFTVDPASAAKLAVPGGESPESMHVTLVYLGKEITPDKLEKLERALAGFASRYAPVSGTIAGPIRFPACERTEGRDVCVASFENADIQEFRSALKECIEGTGFDVDAVNKYSDEQPRGEHGRWVAGGEHNASGDVFISPNTRENMTFEEATAALQGEQHQNIRDTVAQTMKGNGSVEVHDVIGDWSDGAENSLRVQANVADRETLQYLAAKMGDKADQKAVIPFSKNSRGRDALWTIRVYGNDMGTARKTLDEDQIPFRTFEPHGNELLIHVFDPGTALKSNIQNAAIHLGATKIQIARGTGEFLGGDTRGEGHEAYNRVITRYEQRHAA